jgi:hypothetical protein
MFPVVTGSITVNNSENVRRSKTLCNKILIFSLIFSNMSREITKEIRCRDVKEAVQVLAVTEHSHAAKICFVAEHKAFVIRGDKPAVLTNLTKGTILELHAKIKRRWGGGGRSQQLSVMCLEVCP